MRALWITAVLLLVGCADDPAPAPATSTTTASTTETTSAEPSPSSSTTTTTATSSTTTTQPKRDAVTWEVEVRDNSFAPADLTVQAGDTVRFVYVGSNMHTATADNGEFDSGDCPGTSCFSAVGIDSFEWTSSEDDVGDVPYFCEVHGQGMSGTIDVRARYDDTP